MLAFFYHYIINSRLLMVPTVTDVRSLISYQQWAHAVEILFFLNPRTIILSQSASIWGSKRRTCFSEPQSCLISWDFVKSVLVNISPYQLFILWPVFVLERCIKNWPDFMNHLAFVPRLLATKNCTILYRELTEPPTSL